VTVVVPTLNEERYIEACLRSIQTQTYPRERMDIVVVDGGSHDRTREIVEHLAADDPRIHVMDNPDRIQAAGFNRAIDASEADVVSLVSAHSQLDPAFLRECIDEMARSGADNVGGQMLATGETDAQRAIAAAMHSPFGVGGASYHYATEARDVPSVWPGCFRRDVFRRVGVFRADLAVHEDYELNHRIRAAGGRVRFSPRVAASYHVRSSLKALARQYFRYGRAKAGVTRMLPGVLRPYHLGPPLLVVGVIAATVASPFSSSARRALTGTLAAYALVLVTGGTVAGRGRPTSVRRLVPAALATMHVSWGVGFLSGLVTGPPRVRVARDGGGQTARTTS
jgi:GT2 family glycosyltransferase